MSELFNKSSCFEDELSGDFITVTSKLASYTEFHPTYTVIVFFNSCKEGTGGRTDGGQIQVLYLPVS